MLKEYKDYPVIDQKCVYTSKEVGALLGIGEKLVYKLMKSESFPVRKIGVKYIVSKDIFDTWLRTS